MKRTASIFVIAALFALAGAHAHAAPGDRPLAAPLFVLDRTDMVNAGAGDMGAPAANGGGIGEIVLAGVSGTVNKALLYWHGVDLDWPAHGYVGGDNRYEQPQIRFNGNPVVGERLGSGGYNNNWGSGTQNAPQKYSAALYRADVTALVTGNGTYTLEGLADGAGHSASGASLIVYFDDGNPANDVRVEHYEAMDSNVDTGKGYHWLSRLPLHYVGGRAELWLHVADGQRNQTDGTFRIRVYPGLLPGDASNFSFSTPYRGQHLWGGDTVPHMLASRPSGGGGLWDIQQFDITPALHQPGEYLVYSYYGVDGIDFLTLMVMQVVQSAPGAPPAVTPWRHDFGDHPQGTPSAPQSFTFHNRQNDSITVTSVTRGHASFSIASDTCTGVSLAPGATCVVEVTCAPNSAPRDFRSQLVFNWQDGFGNARTSGAIERCSGVAEGPVGRIAVDPGEAWLGAVSPGSSSPSRRFTVQSIGDSDATMTKVEVTGAYRLEYAKVEDTCLGSTLAPGEQCHFDLQFRPRPDRPLTTMPAEVVVEFTTPGVMHVPAAIPIGATVAPAADHIFADGFEAP
ncbi:choice-of-anchor D domain-containing protein [Pseudofulvimonas gallinarii]|uniref:Choice-of-anchor D domain-containing protein n=1 Tax=Pseudofulvimonas gallinarii TaxID=634155 RepID=A0A4R3LAJ1_9GAMM|nr:choice-of-anchor D domain-containing protein [Pseudofulvimonas gallinarii]TCS94526.1 hypothetical protein EDC25_12145 [Pseudofulvimonas gallinarii]